ncbi:MAG: hypothetical protein WDO68_17030 [Gammaproteobacteria bacterium]
MGRSVTRCVLLLAVFSTHLHAAAATSGQRKFVIADCDKDRIALRFTTEKAPLLLRTGDLTSTAAAAVPVAASMTWEKPVATEAAIHEYEVSGRLTGGCPEAGSYTVPLTIIHDGGTSETLEFELVRRVEPVLDAPASITLVVEKLPWSGSENVSVTPLRVRETSHSGAIGGLSASGGELKSAAGEGTGITLNPASEPLSLASGEGKDLNLVLSHMPDAGSFSTRLVLHTASLKTNVNSDVTIKVRHARWCLGAILLLGVLLGWLVNVKLAAVSTLRAAQLEALRAVNAIVRDAGAQRDSAVQQRMLRIATTLEGEVRSARDPKDLNKIVENKKTQVDAVLSVATQSVGDLQARLTATRGLLDPNNRVLSASVTAALAPLFGTLSTIERASLTGDVEDALRRLSELDITLPAAVIAALRPVIQDLHRGLGELGKWSAPAQALETLRQTLLVDLATAFGKVAPAELVTSTDDIVRSVERLVTIEAPDDMKAAFGNAATILSQGSRTDLAQAVRGEIANLERMTHRDEDTQSELGKLSSARVRVAGLLLGADPANGSLGQAVADGDFPTAARLIAPPPAAVPAAPAVLLPAAMRARMAAPQGLPAAPPVPPIAPRLRIPPWLPVGQVAQASLDWRGERKPAAAAATWVSDPATAAVFSNQTIDGADLEPKLPGFLEIRFSIANPPLSVSGRAFVGELAATPSFTKFEEDEKNSNRAIALATALLTTFVGYQIFAGSWYGTFGDYFSAFIWGFFGQFGLERIRDATKTIVSRTL